MTGASKSTGKAGRALHSDRQILGNLQRGACQSTPYSPSTASEGQWKHRQPRWAFLVAAPAECDGNGPKQENAAGSYLPNPNPPPLLILRSRLLALCGCSFCRAWSCARSAALLRA